MKQKKLIEKSIRIATLLTLTLIAAKCAAQDLRIETAVGLVVFSESCQPDEICFSFGVLSSELTVECGNDLPGKVAAAARMADMAGVDYPDFLRENGVRDSPAVQTYFYKCLSLRRQFFSVIDRKSVV